MGNFSRRESKELFFRQNYPARARSPIFFIVLIVYTLSLSPFIILVKVHFAAKKPVKGKIHRK